MNVLVIGSGGREHALCWKLAQSDRVTSVYCAPGNAGIASVAENIAVPVDDFDGLVEFAQKHQIALTIVGPEYPLTLGIVDAFEQRGLRVFGPSKSAARIEGSKVFAKEVMQRAGIATAEFSEFTDIDKAKAYIHSQGAPIVVKADGLAAGKGVYVCSSESEAIEAVEYLLGEAGFESIVVEEHLHGKEVSYIVATDGKRIVPFASSHDYKRIGDNDEGPNTGGMGTVSPTPRLAPGKEEWVLENVMRPAIQAMEEMGCPFRGFLYAGLMIAPDDSVKILEFNARMGDPECQVILRRTESDLFDLLYQLSESGEKSLPANACSSDSAVCVVLASEGYPQSPVKGDEISGIVDAEKLEGCVVFHAGTAKDSQGKLITAGGRVLNVTSSGRDLDDARSSTYTALERIKFRGQQFRKDIGAKHD